MQPKLVRLFLSGLLILPVCLTGVVTAYQLQSGDAASAVPATPIVPAVAAVSADPSEPAAAKDESETGAAAATIAPSPTPEPTPEGAMDQLRAQRKNREYFARLTVDGLLPGRMQYVDGRSRGLVPAKRLTVSFWQLGKLVSQARPGVDGFFQAAGLVPGFYTVVASGLDGVATFGIEIKPALTVANNPKPDALRPDTKVRENVRAEIGGERFRLQQTESEDIRDAESFLRIDAVLVPPRDIPTVKQIMDAYVAPLRRPAVMPAMSNARALKNAEQTIQLVKQQRAQFSNLTTAKPVQAQAAVQAAPQQPIRGSWGTPLRMPTFYTHSDNSVGGRITYFQPDVTNRDIHFRAPVQGGTVYLIRNGTVVGQASSDQTGTFRIPAVPVGDYTFVSTGSAGVAAFGVQVMPHSPDAALAPEGKAGSIVREVSSIRLVQGPGGGQGQSGVSDQDVDVDTSNPNDVAAADMFGPFGEGGGGAGAGGGAGGGVGGGGAGGGGGGGGGLGGLLGAALIGGGIAGGLAASQNDQGQNNNNQGNGPIASTSTP